MKYFAYILSLHNYAICVEVEISATIFTPLSKRSRVQALTLEIRYMTSIEGQPHNIPDFNL